MTANVVSVEQKQIMKYGVNGVIGGLVGGVVFGMMMAMMGMLPMVAALVEIAIRHRGCSRAHAD